MAVRPGWGSLIVAAACAAAWAGAVACSGPDFEECSVRCGAGGLCPTGTTCAPDGYCHGDGAAAACAPPPAAGDSDSGPPGTATDAGGPVCVDMTCESPPSECHADVGTCVDGLCVYDFVDGAVCSDGDACTRDDRCGAGECAGAPLVCDTAPPPACSDEGTLRVFSAPGTCSGGACDYAFTETTCAAGCAGGACVTPQACIDVCQLIDDCGASFPSCEATCRDTCTPREVSQLAVCATTACFQLQDCLNLVSCL